MTAFAPEADRSEMFLRQRCTPCLAKLNQSRPWIRTLAMDLGTHCVGVRVTSEAAAEAIEAVFAEARRPDLDAVAPPNFSVDVEDDNDSRSCRRFHFVYQDHVMMARRADPADLLLDLEDLLRATRLLKDPALPAARATVLLRGDGQAALLPWRWHLELVPHQRRLALSGLHMLAADLHQVDAADASVITSTRHLGGAQGRASIALWAVRTADAEEEWLGRGRAIQALFGDVANAAHMSGRKLLDDLAELTHRVRVVGLPLRSEFDLLATTIGLATGHTPR